jgi:hypothetical protein
MSDKESPSQALRIDGDMPFLLLANCDPMLFDDGVFEPYLRRMGLEPCTATASLASADVFGDHCLEIRFAEQRAVAGRLSDAVIDRVAQPDRPLLSAEVLVCAPISAASGGKVADSRELFKLTVLLIDLTRADHVYWSPAGLWSDAWAFRAAVAEMLASGMPPVLHLVAFNPTGTDGALRSKGLAFFASQELEVRDGGGLPERELVRRLARLAIDAMVNGAISVRRRFPGLVSDERIDVVPGVGEDGTATLFISVERG